MAVQSQSTCQYRSLAPLERDICRVLAAAGPTGRDALREYLRTERGSLDGQAFGDALYRLRIGGFIDGDGYPRGINRRYELTAAGRRELERHWSWQERSFLGDRDAI